MLRAALALVALCSSAVAAFGAPAMDAVMAAQDFSGVVLVIDRGAVVFDRAYGLADRDAALPNRTTTAFRIGSLTRLYITTQIVALAEKHKLALDNTAEQFADGAGPILIGDLLKRTDDPATLVLGRVLAGAAHASLPDALGDMFSSLWMTASAVDTGGASHSVAQDYRGPPQAVVAYSTTRDLLRWTNAFFGGDLVSAEGRRMLLKTWDKVPGAPGDDTCQTSSAEAAIIVQPGIGRTVIILSNGGSSAPADIGARLYRTLPNH